MLSVYIFVNISVVFFLITFTMAALQPVLCQRWNSLYVSIALYRRTSQILEFSSLLCLVTSAECLPSASGEGISAWWGLIWWSLKVSLEGLGFQNLCISDTGDSCWSWWEEFGGSSAVCSLLPCKKVVKKTRDLIFFHNLTREEEADNTWKGVGTWRRSKE